MATEESNTISDLIEEAREMFALNPIMAPQMEQFWKAQESILEETEAYSKAWFERRHEAAKTALEALHEATGDASGSAVVAKSIIDWQQHSLLRIAEDVQQWLDLCSRCAGRFTSIAMEASKEGIEEVEKRAKSVVPAHHSTPV